jgi:phospholipid/cholesterol/gamma-HCH transport system substrate-binding protein
VISLRAASIRLFVFTVFTVAVTVWLASAIGNFRLVGDAYDLRAEFSDASGLLRGDMVRAAGVEVGRVKDIRVRDGIAVVTLEIDGHVELPSELEARIRFRNLIGQKMVTLVQSSGHRGGTMASGDLIALESTEPSFDITELFDGLRPLIRSTDPADINTVSRELVAALGGREDTVAGLLGNIAEISDSLASKDRALAALLDDANIVTGDLAERDEQLQRTLDNMGRFFTELAASRSELDQALVVLDDAAVRLARLVRRNDANIRGSIDALAVVLDAVNDRRRDLRRALNALPEMLVGVERVTTYGEWSMLHLVRACRDEGGRCGTRRPL